MNPGRPQQRADISVVQVAEALIQGEVLIALQERGEAAPAWGYLNLLAHSDRSSLRRVRDFNQSRMPLSGWGTVVFDLIVDILDLVPTDEELVALQRTALVPVELKSGAAGKCSLRHRIWTSSCGAPCTATRASSNVPVVVACDASAKKPCEVRGVTEGPARSLF